MTLLPHKRTEFPARVRLEAWQRCQINGVPHCEGCGFKIIGRPTYDHTKPDALGGEAKAENCKVLCSKCDRLKTYGEDIPTIAKCDRIARKNARIVPRKHSWPKQSMRRWNG